MSGGFALGGKLAKEDLKIRMLRESQRPGLPDTRDRILVIPGRNGAYDFGADLGPRPFQLKCAVNEQTPAGLQTAVEALTTHLLDAKGKPRTLELTLDLRPNRKYSVRYSGSLPIDRVVGLGQFTLPLTAYDPAAYGSSSEFDVTRQYDTGLQYNTGLLYPNPIGFDWLYPEQRSSLQNYSSLETDMIITITGTVAIPKITHEQSGKWLQLPSITGIDTLIIDTGKYTVKKNGVNVLGQTSGDFWKLASGANDFTFQCGSANAVVSYNWQHKYL